MKQSELFSFHQCHFSDEAVANFGSNFLTPSAHGGFQLSGKEEDREDEDDGLGYYEDGVKRTLTDEQVEIFRHSELRELKKQQEKSLRAKQVASTLNSTDATRPSLSHNHDGSGTSTTSRIAKKKKGKRGGKRATQEPKPDLRKRTWDVVESGLDSLEYD